MREWTERVKIVTSVAAGHITLQESGLFSVHVCVQPQQDAFYLTLMI